MTIAFTANQQLKLFTGRLYRASRRQPRAIKAMGKMPARERNVKVAARLIALRISRFAVRGFLLSLLLSSSVGAADLGLETGRTTKPAVGVAGPATTSICPGGVRQCRATDGFDGSA